MLSHHAVSLSLISILFIRTIFTHRIKLRQIRNTTHVLQMKANCLLLCYFAIPGDLDSVLIFLLAVFLLHQHLEVILAPRNIHILRSQVTLINFPLPIHQTIYNIQLNCSIFINKQPPTPHLKPRFPSIFQITPIA